MADRAAKTSISRSSRPRRLRPGILDIYLVRGLAAPFLLVSFGVCAAMMLERALRLIHELAASGADVGYFLPLLAQLAPYYVGLALPAGFFVALVLLVARLDERVEIEAMLGSGLSLARIAAPLAAAALVVALASLLAGGWLEPHGRYGFRSTMAAAVNSGRIGRLQPRAIYQPSDGLALTFDRRAADGSVGGMFVWQRLPSGRELVLTAGSARIAIDPEALDLVIGLREGRYVADPVRPGTARPDVVGFRRMHFRESLLVSRASWERGWDQKEMTLSELAAALRTGHVRAPRRALEAELYSRLARALTIPLLPFLALPLAFAVKKGRRGLGILIGGGVLAAFHHGLNSAKSLGVAGATDPRLAILTATGVFAVVVGAIFWSGRKLPSHSPVADAAKVMAAFAARLHGRGPRVATARRRTIPAYLRATLMRHVAIAAVAIVLILQMVDMFERGDEFVQRGMGFVDTSRYALLRLPPILQQSIPIAALAGGMSAFMALSRTSEMVAIRAAGVSQFGMMRMALPVFLGLSAAAFLIAEYTAPASQLRFRSWWEATAPPETTREAASRWFRIESDIVRAAAAAPDGTRLKGIDVIRRDGRGLITARMAAARATATADGWNLSEARITRFAGNGPTSDLHRTFHWQTGLKAQDVQRFFAAPHQISSAAARRSLDVAAPVDRGDSYFRTRLLRTAAEPVAPVVMLLLALPLAFVGGRTGRFLPALLYAAGGGLLYLVADGVLTVMAQVGMMPPVVGAWTAPIVGLLTGWCVLLYAER